MILKHKPQFDINLNNPLAKGLEVIGGPEISGYRFMTSKYSCRWNIILPTYFIEKLEKGVEPWTIHPENIIEYHKL
jgi:hypothetical protein